MLINTYEPASNLESLKTAMFIALLSSRLLRSWLDFQQVWYRHDDTNTCAFCGHLGSIYQYVPQVLNKVLPIWYTRCQWHEMWLGQRSPPYYSVRRIKQGNTISWQSFTRLQGCSINSKVLSSASFLLEVSRAPEIWSTSTVATSKM